MDQHRSRLKLSENFERRWSMQISGEIHMDQSLVHTFSWGNSYGPMVLKVLLKFGPPLADCVNSSPPLILRKFQGFGGIWAISGKFGKFRENSGEFSGIQCGFVALSMNSVGIPGRFRGNAGCSGRFGVWGGFG